MSRTPYESPYYLELVRKYTMNPNAGTFNEYKEEFKSLVALDWFSYVRKARRGIPEFCLSDSIREWLQNNDAFHGALTFINCFFLRKENDPFPERVRFHRPLPKLQRFRVRKRQANRIHSDIGKELHNLDRAARSYRRHEDTQKIREMKMAMWAIREMVVIYFVESAPQISEECYQRLCAVVPSAADVYVRRNNGRYVTRERLPAGRLFGQAGADVILISRLERFSKYMGYFRKK